MTFGLALWVRWLSAALMAVAPAPYAMAQSATPVVQADRALELAQVLNSDANIVGSDTDDEKMLALIPELFGSKDDLAAIEAKYPGISVEMTRAALPRLKRSARARLPELWRRQADLYRSTLTPAEIGRLADFYRSPTGAKMIASLFRNAKPTAMLAEAKKSDDFRISPESAIKDIGAVTRAILSEMKADDQKRIVETFGEPVLAAKMRGMAPKTQGITLDWMNESEAGEEDELETLVTTILERREKEKAAQ